MDMRAHLEVSELYRGLHHSGGVMLHRDAQHFAFNQLQQLLHEPYTFFARYLQVCPQES